MPRSDFNRLALGTRLASGLGRARQKYVFVPYGELAYVKRICQVKEEPRRTRIEAERFRAGWTRLPAVDGRGRKRRAKGALASSSVAAAAKAEQEI
jgi:hypothetical protein